MNEPRPEPPILSAYLLGGMAAAIGVDLSKERAAALATQAGAHFALLRALDAVANPTTEPAAEFRLDCWTSSGDD